jgi:hypothetical protein
MKLIAATLLLASVAAFSQERTFTGVITDSMCGADHTKMKITPDSKCIHECVHSSDKIKFALYDGKQTYKLSDQARPAQFAGQKVRVSGMLYPQTGIIAVTRIELAR